MESIEAEADSIDAAIDAALKTLGVPRDRVEIEILASGSRGLFGIGSRKAKVRATLRSPMREPAAPPAERPTTTPPPDDRAAERARQVLREIVTLMNVDATVHVRTTDERIVLDLSGDASGILIGRRGQMLDALEYVLNRIVGRDEGSAVRIVIDSENYRQRRRETLENLARRMAEQAKKKRKPVALNPMSPRDRRIVHLILQEDPLLTTKSAGTGYFRRLIIIPGGAGKVARGG